MKISHGIEYVFVRLLAGLFRLLPHRAAVIFGGRLGSAANNLWLSRHKVVVENLRIAFGNDMDDSRRDEIARGVFVNIGRTLAEVCRFPKLDREKILNLVSADGTESFQEVLDHGKGGILVGSHFGNWELVGAFINAIGYPVDFLVRGQHNALVDAYLTDLRAFCGVRVIHSEKDGGMREILRALKQNRQVAIVSDQHAGSQGIIINFFGRPVSVPRAPATLAVRTGAPLVTGYIMRNEDLTHHCHFYPPIYPDMEADPDAEVYRLTKLYTERYEGLIRKHPEAWLWTHRRFKYVPKGEQSEGTFVE
ncbi:MAG: lysophospholipid acyltransferase family protein [Candidatus Zixiibacteriota bacterium]